MLWLVSGGSSLQLIPPAQQRLKNMPKDTLSIGLVDERYGSVGHKDSNWLALKESGFSFTNITQLPVLTGDDASTTARKYSSILQEHIDRGSQIIAIVGIGADGHTAGMLPSDRSSFSQFMNSNLYVAYKGPDFQRVTATMTLLQRCDHIFGYVQGADKVQQIRHLSDDVPLHVQPAQIFKTTRNTTIYVHKEDA